MAKSLRKAPLVPPWMGQSKSVHVAGVRRRSTASAGIRAGRHPSLRPQTALLVLALVAIVTAACGMVALALHSRLGSDDRGGAGILLRGEAGGSRFDAASDRQDRRQQRQWQQVRQPTGPSSAAVGGSSSSPCQTLYFWGGHKSGSTTLAALLKHRPDDGRYAEHDPAGQFVQSPKEVCWALAARAERWRRISRSCGGGRDGDDDDALIGNKKGAAAKATTATTAGKRFALDGCPFYRTPDHARQILSEDPNAKFVMLVRDPVDRLVSHLNADLRRAGNRNNRPHVLGAAAAAAAAGKDLAQDESNNFDDDVRRIIARGRARADLRRREPPDDAAPGELTKGRKADRNKRGRGRDDSDGGRRGDRRRQRVDGGGDAIAAIAAGGDRKDEMMERIVDRGGGRRRPGTIRGDGRGEGRGAGGGGSPDHDHWSLSTYGANLQNLLGVVSDPSQILVVQTSALTDDAQGVVDAVMDHIGGMRKVVGPMIRQNDGGALGGYRDVTAEVRKEAGGALRSDSELLERLVGKKFAWSSSASPTADAERRQAGNEEEDDIRWTAVVPAGIGI